MSSEVRYVISLRSNPWVWEGGRTSRPGQLGTRGGKYSSRHQGIHLPPAFQPELGTDLYRLVWGIFFVTKNHFLIKTSAKWMVSWFIFKMLRKKWSAFHVKMETRISKEKYNYFFPTVLRRTILTITTQSGNHNHLPSVSPASYL